MLNMQNVKDIEITEGSVRTIHDKDSKLIWGRLAYDTKYDGDTTQQTYTGKNLFNKDAAPTTKFNDSSLGVTPLTTGVRLTSNASVTYSGAVYIIGKKEDYIGDTLTFTTHSKSSSTNNPRVYIGTCNSGGGNRTSKANEVGNSGEYDFSLSWLVENDDSNEYICVALYTTASVSVSIGDYMDYTDIQLEVGSTATSYEPYVGGVPSPNPDYPQDVNVVTGEQTITLSDGVDSEDYTVNLGSTELCKIDDYQDYIYKSGDDWYVHKMTGKYTFTGSEPIVYNSNGGFILRSTDLPTTIVNINTPPLRGFCDRFIVNTTTTTWTGEGKIGLSSSSTFWCQSSVLGTTQQSCEQWLTDNTLTLYYTLATPADTQITDTTLITQLNAIHDFLTRYGYNSSVTGNLPLIINQTSL